MNDSSILDQPPPPRDARIFYGADPNNFADLRLPQRTGPHPVAIVIHGGFWRARYDLEHIGHLCAALTGGGLATWSIEYRRLGNPGGGWTGTFLDVAAAANYLRAIASQHQLDLNRVIVMGHSAGGHLALWYAGLKRIPQNSPIYSPDPLPVRAVISLAGVSDLRRASELALSSGVTHQLIGGSPREYPERYSVASPIELLPMGVRQFLLHGIDDENVPFEMSERYVETAHAKGDDTTLISFPNTGHFELIDPSSHVWQRLLETVLDALE
ncbi:MAG: alpha/beta fold hydrolase [Chloroflexi bacterium]|nr:alpha/beta fold hydrolase [Chloroflexota bacterium]